MEDSTKALAIRPIIEYARYVLQQGSEAEKRILKDELSMIGEWRSVFPESHWEPMDHVRLIDSLMEKSERVAQRRWRLANERRYRDFEGKVGRTLDEERVTTRSQLALQIALGLPHCKPDTMEEARTVGNAGSGNDVYVPIFNPLYHHLLIPPRMKNEMICWLVVPEGDRSFRIAGWIEAKNGKSEQWMKVTRAGQSKNYWIPTEALHSVAKWWERGS